MDKQYDEDSKKTEWINNIKKNSKKAQKRKYTSIYAKRL